MVRFAVIEFWFSFDFPFLNSNLLAPKPIKWKYYIMLVLIIGYLAGFKQISILKKYPLLFGCQHL